MYNSGSSVFRLGRTALNQSEALRQTLSRMNTEDGRLTERKRASEMGKSDTIVSWFAYRRPVSSQRTELARVTSRHSPKASHFCRPLSAVSDILMKFSPSPNYSTTIISEIIFFLLSIETVHN